MIEKNFIKLYEKSFKDNWLRSALSDYGDPTPMRYADVAEEIARIHLLYQKMHLRKGDKVALVGKNSTRWVLVYMATITYGAVIVPILQDFNPNDIHHIVNHSDAHVLWVSDSIWENLEEEKMEMLRAIFSLNDSRCICQHDGETIQKLVKNLDHEFAARYPQGFSPADVQYTEVSNEELLLLNYTSGTTGFTKGVMLTANNMAGNVLFAINSGLMHNQTRILSFLPLAHAYGCAFEMLSPLANGGHVTLLGKIPSPKILVQAMSLVKPTIILTVPLVLEKIYKKQVLPLLNRRAMRLALNIPLLDARILSTIQKKVIAAFGGEFMQVVVGGAPLNPEVEAFLLKIKFPFTVGYGMTECAPLISYSPYYEYIESSCGKILNGMEVRIDASDPTTKVGEICVRGENVMSGYYKNDVATHDAFDKDGWFHTGDLGTVDNNGVIYIRGRSKSMILGASGQNIYPEEIEAKLNNLPFVMESLVIEHEGKLFALVYPDYEGVDESHIAYEDLEMVMEQNRIALNKDLAVYETISKIVLYPNEFEKTPKKSIKRYLYINALK
ncbi:AMP-binding protein [Microbacter margulisiae]|uniref:Long-chain acyl-CoA synthetase n=1 Tax=Microbacter margulisiae TaxID=1350067 RepID=A0A7W5DSD2_9PORP|nr:AMP-binding protein [Microbacter margulisiae]MBB3188185.1 long-chain acyl-CoA synthetase [Microbacter margulisiae]